MDGWIFYDSYLETIVNLSLQELWEAKSKEEGTPLSKFYASWRKLKDRQLQKDIAGKDQVS